MVDPKTAQRFHLPIWGRKRRCNRRTKPLGVPGKTNSSRAVQHERIGKKHNAEDKTTHTHTHTAVEESNLAGRTNQYRYTHHRPIWVHEAVQHENEAVGCHSVVILQPEPFRFGQLPRRPSALDSGRAHPKVKSEQA